MKNLTIIILSILLINSCSNRQPIDKKDDRKLSIQNCCIIDSMDKEPIKILKSTRVMIYDTITVCIDGQLIDVTTKKGIMSAIIYLDSDSTITNGDGKFKFMHIKGQKPLVSIKTECSKKITGKKINNIDCCGEWQLQIGVKCIDK
jgi:hypothetical protein